MLEDTFGSAFCLKVSLSINFLKQAPWVGISTAGVPRARIKDLPVKLSQFTLYICDVI